MAQTTRKHYIDNLRWIVLLLLIPYHTAMAWNVWGEPNYIFFEGNRLISSIVVFFSPYFMPLLFLLAGISTRLALQVRTRKEYLIERVKKLLIPFLFGTIVIMPIMTFFADRYYHSYAVGFLEHCAFFFTHFTDLTGADGGFSMGQFWFLLYLLVISAISMGLLPLLNRIVTKVDAGIPFWIVLILGAPLPLLSELLSIGGKSLVEYTYLFMLGYMVFSRDGVIQKAEKYRWYLLGIGLVASILNVYLFIWSNRNYAILNTIAKYVSEWFMLLAMIGLAKRYLNFNGKVSHYMKTRSFLYYIYHFVWVVLAQFLLYHAIGNRNAGLFFGTIILSSIMTFLTCEISIRIPLLRMATGIKSKAKK